MKNLPRYLRMAALCLLAVFLVQSVTEIFTYDGRLTAVPLWMFLALYALLFVLPAAVMLAASALLQRKYGKKG